jgi:hypothetical protein
VSPFVSIRSRHCRPGSVFPRRPEQLRNVTPKGRQWRPRRQDPGYGRRPSYLR